MSETNPLLERRIKDATAAAAIYQKLRKGSDKRRKNAATVLNQLNGGKPMSDSELVKKGQGWRCNTNFRDASSTLEQVLISYWRLLHDTTNLVNITAYSDNPNSEQWSASLQKNFNRFVSDWADGYVLNYLQLATNHVALGVGALMWDDPDSPRWSAVKLGDIDVPERTKASIEAVKLAAITQEADISDLWDKIRTPERKSSSARMGWNVSALQKFLWNAIKGANERPPGDDYAAVEDMIRNNDLSYSADIELSATVSVVHLFVKEYDGKISTYVIAPGHDVDEYLFDDFHLDNRPSRMVEKISAVFFESGNGQFWGSKGFGQKNHQIAAIQNRLKSRAVDRTILDGLNFRDLSDGGLSGFPVANFGPFNLLPREIEQVPSYPTGTPTLETIAMLDQTSNNNNARYRDQSRQISQTDTATQANILANLQSQVDVANATLYLKQIATNIFSEQLRRLRLRGNPNEDAKKFRKRCVEDDRVDEKWFHETEISVTTGSDPGAASLALQGEYAKELIAMSGDPDIDSRWAKEKFVSARFGASAVTKALRPVDASSDIAAQRLGLMENSDMGEGQALPVDPKDNHAAHVPVHLQPAAMIVDQFESTGNVNPDGLVALQNLIPHLEAHFEYLKLDKRFDSLRKQLWPEFTRVQSAAEGLFKQIERMQSEAVAQGAAQQPPGDSEGGFSPAAAVGAIAQQ